MKLKTGEIYQLQIVEDERLRCYRCGSSNVRHRFGSREHEEIYDYATQKYVPMDSEDYQIHFDTYCCLDCREWDFPEAFESSNSYARLSCPYCARDSRFKVIMWDAFSGLLEMRCEHKECGTELRFWAEPEGKRLQAIWTPVHKQFQSQLFQTLESLRSAGFDEEKEAFEELTRRLRLFMSENKPLLDQIILDGSDRT
jgi:hypothetical protein